MNITISLLTFCNVVKGIIVSGPSEFEIQHIAERSIHLKKTNTVLFNRESKSDMKWSIIRRHKPCAIVFEKGNDLTPYIPYVTYVMVESLEQSYWDFVHFYRNLFNIPVFSITGSYGKSTTKELIAHILNDRYNIQSINKNNDHFSGNLGYLCGITSETDIVVIETPVGRPGLLEHHCEYFKPTIGIITNIDNDHIKRCGTVENIIESTGEILRGLNYEGILLLNADDESIKKISLDSYNGFIIYFGVHSESDYRAINIQFSNLGMNFTLVHNDIFYNAFVPGYGEHLVYFALSAIAAVHQIGFPIREAIYRLSTFTNIMSNIEAPIDLEGASIFDETGISYPIFIETALSLSLIKRKKEK